MVMKIKELKVNADVLQSLHSTQLQILSEENTLGEIVQFWMN